MVFMIKSTCENCFDTVNYKSVIVFYNIFTVLLRGNNIKEKILWIKNRQTVRTVIR